MTEATVIPAPQKPQSPLVSVVTATTGNPLLVRNVKSVLAQEYDRIQHLIVVDGPEHGIKVTTLLNDNGLLNSNLDVCYLPYATGTNRWNGHRIYGAGTYLCDGDYVIFLDDDNSLEPSHITSLLEVLLKGQNHWAYSFRNINDKNGEFICEDNCESLGKWHSIIHPNDFFVDVNCYMLRRDVAVAMSPVWFRKFREPGQMEIDRAMYVVLNQISKKFDTSYKYTVNYTVGNSPLSVQAGFFLEGNQRMLGLHKGELPWKKAKA